MRFSACTACYFAQGVPIGLLTVAIPARLAELGASAGEVALFLFVVSLPWAFKLVVGPFMDRFTFLAMGFRRPWVILTQGGLTLSFVTLALIGDLDNEALAPLLTVGFITNAFAAFQDVAVDGMAIDILQPDERGRANAFMGFGQAAGFSAYGALCGTLLPLVGLSVTALVCAVTVAVIFLFVAVFRERPGERLMPWTAGEAVPRPRMAEVSVGSIFRNLTRVVFLPMSLLLVAVEFVNRVRDGVAEAVFPVFAVQELGVTSAQYTQFKGYAGFGAALFVALLGVFVDRHGARRFLLVGLVLGAACHFAVGLLPALWDSMTFVVQLAWLVYIFQQLVFVAIIALFMTLCWTQVAATQFAIYMSLANLSRTAGVGLFAVVADHLSFAQDFVIMGALLLLSAVLLMLFNESAHRRRLDQLEAEELPARSAEPAAAG